jgi:hypothetical protein
MIPHLWRWSQWIAWLGFVSLAALVLLGGRRSISASGASQGDAQFARRRLGLLLALAIGGLTGATIAIEWLHHPSITLFQPFRLATVVRGLCVVAFSGHIAGLWQRGERAASARAAVLAVALTGDWCWMFAVAGEVFALVSERAAVPKRVAVWGLIAVWMTGCAYMSQHDSHDGHVRLACAARACRGAARRGQSADHDCALSGLADPAHEIPRAADR